MFSVEGKWVFVTGGSRGIGLGISRGFVEGGAHVIIASRKPKEVVRAAQQLCALGRGSCTAVELSCDFALKEGVEAAAKEVLRILREKRGEEALDCLVNNSGASWGEALETFPSSGWDKVMNINLRAPFFLVQLLQSALALSASRCTHSSVINIASIAGIQPQTFPTFPYDASKSGLIHLSKQLAGYLAPQKITVNCISPGLVLTNMSKTLAVYHKDGKALPADVSALGPAGELEDMAAGALYFAARSGKWVTGANLIIDGGKLTSHPFLMKKSQL